MDNTFIPKGMEIIKQAIDEDNADNYEKAYSLYEQGIKHLLTGLKYVKQEKSKQIITQKADQYLTRMEQLKDLMDGKSRAPVMAGGVEGSKNSGNAKDKAGDSKEDAETTKLKGALEGAIVREKPNVKWEDVAGLEQAKKLLKETVILPAKFPHLFQGAVKPWRGILLYGPPGTGKSYLAKALATEAGSTFFSVSSSDLVSKFQGESERLVRNLFELARENVPSIIFIDEVDSLCGSRSEGENESSRRIKTEFLVQMQGVGKGNDGVLVLGATNTPWELDPAMRRRFEKRVYIPLPEPQARAAMFKIHVKDTPHTLLDGDFMHLAKLTDGLQGGDISICVREALYAPVRLCQDATHFKKVTDPAGKYDFVWTPCSPGDPNAVEMSIYDIEGDKLLPPALELKHFLKAVANTKAAVSAADIERHDKWTQEFGMEGYIDQLSTLAHFMNKSRAQIINVALMGLDTVGKSTLAHRLAHPNQPLPAHFPLTITPELLIGDFEGDNDKRFHFWDLPGQDRCGIQSKVIPNKPMPVLLLCFSLTDISSFNNILHFLLWEIQGVRENALVYLLGMKSDQQSTKREVTKDSIDQLIEMDSNAYPVYHQQFYHKKLQKANGAGGGTDNGGNEVSYVAPPVIRYREIAPLHNIGVLELFDEIYGHCFTTLSVHGIDQHRDVDHEAKGEGGKDEKMMEEKMIKEQKGCQIL